MVETIDRIDRWACCLYQRLDIFSLAIIEPSLGVLVVADLHVRRHAGQRVHLSKLRTLRSMTDSRHPRTRSTVTATTDTGPDPQTCLVLQGLFHLQYNRFLELSDGAHMGYYYCFAYCSSLAGRTGQ